jgi:iron complex transport system permease protein
LKSRLLPLSLLGIACAVSALLALGLGAFRIAPVEVLAILLDALALVPHEADATERAVLLAVRLPRVVLAMVVGAALAVSGTALQGLFRNPLVEPGLLGIQAGAALAVALAVSVPMAVPAVLLAQRDAFAAAAGGLVVLLLAVRLGARDGGLEVARLLLVGVALNALCFALVGLLAQLGDDARLRTITAWSLGGLGAASRDLLLAALLPAAVGIGILIREGRALNALALGEAQARHLGLDVVAAKRRIVLATALAVGAATAAAGAVSFVGLVVPHLLRLVLGPDHRVLLPASALLGAALLVLSDLAARVVLAPAELPLGVVTALIGGPFFLSLVVRARGKEAYT